MKRVAVDEKLRNAASNAEKMLKHKWVDFTLNKDIFHKVQEFASTEEVKNLNYEQRQFLEKTLRDGRRNGLLLGKDDFEEIKSMKKYIAELEIDFNKCLNEDTSHIFVHEKDLGGISKDFIDSLEKVANGKLKVTTKNTDYLAILNHCNNSMTRFLMEKMYESRCVTENTPRIEKLIQLRHKKATLLGYPNHASFALEESMAKNPHRVKEFFANLIPKLKNLWKKEKKKMLRLKEDEARFLDIKFDGEISQEDFA